MPAKQSSSTRLPLWLISLLVAAGYFVLARLSLFLSFGSSNATPVWPPSGFAFAAILIFGYRIAPGIFLGAFTANLVVFQANHTAGLPLSTLVSSIIGIGNMGEAIAGYFLLSQLIPNPYRSDYFSKVHYIFKFLVTALVMCLVGSFFGATSVYLAGIISQDQYSVAWLTWWLGDCSGILLVTPFLLVWINFFREKQEAFSATKISHITALEDLSLFLLVIISSGVVFDNWFFNPVIFRWAFWVIPVIVWAAIPFNLYETITAVVLCAGIAVWGTINHHGPFASVSLNQSLLTVQAFTGIISITALTLKASIIERNNTEDALRSAGDQLDIRVKERTAELEERNRFIETIFDSVEDLMAVFDTKTNYLSVNKKIEDLYKLKRKDIIGQNILDLFPGVRSSGMYDNLQKAIAGEPVHNISYRSVVSNRYFENFYIPLRNNRHEVYGVLVIGHDNTVIMEATAKIEDMNTRLNEAQSLAHMGSWQWDILTNRITWSDELYRIYGVDPDNFEATYENYLRFMHPDDKDDVNKIVQEAYAGKQSFDFYHRIIRSDGKERIIHGRGRVFTNEVGEAISMAGTAQDVTEIKLAEQEIKQMADELRRYNKDLEQTNKALESFTFVASHDLQEPLRKIRTFLTLIEEKEQSTLSDLSRDYFRRTIRSAEQMQQLIIDLLAYSRATGADEHFKKTDLNDVLAKVRSELTEIIEEKKATVEAGRLPTMNVIPFQFQQLFTNLLSNSIKFARPGVQPHIVISHELVDGNSVDGNNSDPGKKYHLFAVADNGIGFETKYNEKIFGLFQRLNSKHLYSGSGIGLSICKKIVENHGGIINARGERDHGTTIQFYIPS